MVIFILLASGIWTLLRTNGMTGNHVYSLGATGLLNVLDPNTGTVI